MASQTIVGLLTYYKDNHTTEDAEYQDRESLVEIIKEASEMYVEIVLEPDAQRRTVDRLYVKLPVHQLMAAIANVLMQKDGN